jgi:hypothetical protein
MSQISTPPSASSDNFTASDQGFDNNLQNQNGLFGLSRTAKPEAAVAARSQIADLQATADQSITHYRQTYIPAETSALELARDYSKNMGDTQALANGGIHHARTGETILPGSVLVNSDGQMVPLLHDATKRYFLAASNNPRTKLNITRLDNAYTKARENLESTQASLAKLEAKPQLTNSDTRKIEKLEKNIIQQKSVIDRLSLRAYDENGDARTVIQPLSQQSRHPVNNDFDFGFAPSAATPHQPETTVVNHYVNEALERLQLLQNNPEAFTKKEFSQAFDAMEYYMDRDISQLLNGTGNYTPEQISEFKYVVINSPEYQRIKAEYFQELNKY